jgi:hypothetical protein
MSRLIYAVRTVVTNGTLVGTIDALLLCLGITWSIAAAVPAVETLITGRR